MDGVNKIARVIQLGGKPWLIGGTWTAGGRYPKKPNLRKSVKEERFNPQNTAAVWVKESEQVGWFVFDGKPQKERALAPLVMSKLSLNMVPWRGVFRLDGGWWVVAVDDAMALHPLWDVWVPEDQFRKFYEDNSAKWMSFSHGVQMDTPEESQRWLLDGENYRNAPKSAPVISSEQAIQRGVVVLATLSVIAGLGVAGDYFWKIHEAKVQQRQKMLLEAQAKMNAELNQRNQAITKAEMLRDQKQIENSWQDWPRPWENPISWSVFFQACDQSWTGAGRTNDQGWTLTQVKCHWSAKKPSVLVVHKIWTRGMLATVLHAPSGDVQSGGNTIDQMKQVTLPWKKAHRNSGILPLPILSKAQHDWLGESQQWNNVIQIASGAVVSFLAPIPKGTPPQVAKSLHPPVLWKSFPVTFSSVYVPDRWPFWNNTTMVPSRLDVTLGDSNQFMVTGVQYAK